MGGEWRPLIRTERAQSANQSEKMSGAESVHAFLISPPVPRRSGLASAINLQGHNRFRAKRDITSGICGGLTEEAKGAAGGRREGSSAERQKSKEGIVL